jgi:hypothetical protein
MLTSPAVALRLVARPTSELDASHPRTHTEFQPWHLWCSFEPKIYSDDKSMERMCIAGCVELSIVPVRSVLSTIIRSVKELKLLVGVFPCLLLLCLPSSESAPLSGFVPSLSHNNCIAWCFSFPCAVGVQECPLPLLMDQVR